MQKFAYCAAICPPDTPFNIPLIIALQKSFALVLKLHFHRVLEVIRPRMGCNVISLMSVPVVVSEPVAVVPKPKNSMLPLLVILFLVSYGLMALLVVEQSKTIDSQRALIRELFRDSTELSAVNTKPQKDHAPSSSAKTQAPVTQNSSTQHPSTQYPSTQAPSIQAPSSQAGPQHGAQNQASKKKPQFRMPSKPASDLVDDVRTLITI